MRPRNSGPLSWVGSPPAGWSPRPLWAVLERNDGGVWGDDGDIGDTVVLRSTELALDGSWSIEEPAYRVLTTAERANAVLLEGDLVVTKSSGSPEHLGKTGIVDARVAELRPAFSNFMQRLRASKEADAKYLFWLINSSFGRETLNYLGSTTTGLRNLTGGVLGHILFPGPPKRVQRAIADFLDRKTAAIDALVEKKEQVLEVLAEKRQALIWTTVTKGLDSTARRVDSGHEWLGQIPAYWEVARTRHVARLESGHTPSRQHPEYWVPEECTIPWVSLADVWQLREGKTETIRETSEKVSRIGIANSAARLLPAGTVVVSRTASVGFSAIIAEPMATTQDFVNWICGPRLRPAYLLYVFRAMRDEFRRLTMGSTHQTIYMPDVAKFVTPVPPLPEQDAMVDYVRQQMSTLDALTALVGEEVRCLREFRQALITSAVTGQLDVAKEAA